MTLDYLIIGAGPAGLQLAALLERAGHSYLVLEAGAAPGTFFRTYPRHRQLISINKVWTGSADPEFNLRSDWNSLLGDESAPLFKDYSKRYFPAADDLVRYLADFADGLRIEFGVRVTDVAPIADGFQISSVTQSWTARRVIVATGVSQLYVPPIEGAELASRYDTVSVDPDDFVNQRVLIVGKGNSAFETADALIETAAVIHVAGPHGIKLAWQSHYVGHLRAVNNNFLDSYQLKSQNAVLDGTIEKIAERPGGGFRVEFRYARTVEALRILEYDRVILCTGFQFDAAPVAGLAPELAINDRFPAQTPAFESVNVPGLYFAGTLTQQRDFKKSTSGFIHGFRYGVRALHRILEARYHDRPWPSVPMEATPEAITDAIIERINRTSALWQQFAVLADIVTVSSGASYHEEVPVAYFAAGELGPVDLAFVITLEYGPDHDQADPFDITVPRIAENDAGAAHDASYLHPVVRAYRGSDAAGSTVVGEHHLAENLENHWNLPAVHQQPLAVFLKGVLADVR